MKEYKGFKHWDTKRKSAPNFGGTEHWVEVIFRHPDGRDAFAAGHDLADAFRHMRGHIDYLERPRPAPAENKGMGNEIPF